MDSKHIKLTKVNRLTNSRWCYDETPPTTGWTLIFFYLDYTENQQSCLRENAHIYNKGLLNKTRAFLAHLWQGYAVRTWLHHVSWTYNIAWHSFLENNSAEFLDEVRVKINQDFFQSLVAFCYSNIYYWKSITPIWFLHVSHYGILPSSAWFC